jgi:hypothetical protein
MTRVSGHTLIASPCCRTLYKRVRYASMNFSAFEFWTDGWRDGALMPTDGGLRRCQCGKFFLLREAIDIDLPANEDTPFPGHVQDQDLPLAIASATSTPLEITARRNYWRNLNHDYRALYRAHREAAMSDAKSRWEDLWRSKNPDQRSIWQKTLGFILRKPSPQPPPIDKGFAPFTVPEYVPSEAQLANMGRLLELLVASNSDSENRKDNEEISELYKALGRPERALEMLMKTAAEDRDKNFGAIELSLKQGLKGPVRYKY